MVLPGEEAVEWDFTLEHFHRPPSDCGSAPLLLDFDASTDHWPDVGRELSSTVTAPIVAQCWRAP